MNEENKNNQEKISVYEYLNDNALLELTYIPFDSKLEIVGHIIMGIINSVGGLNTSLLRRISTEVFIESISNIDMNITDENGLKGFDILCYKNELDNLKSVLGNEYLEFEQILNERVADYIRTETNPAVTINAIYNQVKEYFNASMDYISKYIQNIDVEKFAEGLNNIVEKVGDANEG